MNLISVELAKGVKYDNVLVLNRQKEAKSEEYVGVEGRILLVGDYIIHSGNKTIRFAVDIEDMAQYARPMKALQSSALLSGALKEIERDPNLKSGTKAAQDAYTYLFETKLPKCKVKVARKKIGQDNVYAFESNGYRLGTVAIGPRGGVKTELVDVQPIINEVLKTFGQVPQTMIKFTVENISPVIGEAFNTVLSDILDGKAVPEKVGKLSVGLSASSNGAYDVELKAGENVALSIPVIKGNIDSRRASEIKVANVFIPGAATIEVKMTPNVK